MRNLLCLTRTCFFLAPPYLRYFSASWLTTTSTLGLVARSHKACWLTTRRGGARLGFRSRPLSLVGGVQRRPRRSYHDSSMATASSADAATTSSLSNFLQDCQAQFAAYKTTSTTTTTTTQQQARVSLVLGNAAGDADSLLSALCWAYVTSTTTDKSGIPVLSIPRHDVTSQRPETLLLLEWSRIVPEQLVDVQDILLADGGGWPCRADVTLVDHNRLDATFDDNKFLDWTVTGILDHHYDEGLYTNVALRDVAFSNDRATVASTATLVAERWLAQRQPQPNKSKVELPSDVALLLLGTILLDSVNMQPAAGKGTSRDQAVLDALLAQTNWQDGKLATTFDLWDDDTAAPRRRPHPTRLFERLQQAKFDPKFWQALSVRDALRLDYKEFRPTGDAAPFGASTVLLDWDTFIKKESVSSSIATYMNDVNISFLAIMCTFTTPNSDALQRQLILCTSADDASLLKQMVEHLQGLDAESNLQLEERTDSSFSAKGLQLRVFDQGKSKASRKQVAPLLIRYFETCNA